MINSKIKGKAGELEFVHYLKEKGYKDARRGQQFCGTPESPDIICESLPKLHFEVKRVQNLNIGKAMEQAIDDCGDKIPVVAHRKNNCNWMITLSADNFFNLIKE